LERLTGLHTFRLTTKYPLDQPHGSANKNSEDNRLIFSQPRYLNKVDGYAKFVSVVEDAFWQLVVTQEGSAVDKDPSSRPSSASTSYSALFLGDVSSEVLRMVEKTEKEYYERDTMQRPSSDVADVLEKVKQQVQLMVITEDVAQQTGPGSQIDLEAVDDIVKDKNMDRDSEETDELDALQIACRLAADEYGSAVRYASAYSTTHRHVLPPMQDLPDPVHNMVEQLEQRASDALARLQILESELQKRGGYLNDETNLLDKGQGSFLQGFYKFPSTIDVNKKTFSR